MNRALRTALISAAVLLSGTVALAVASTITPLGVEKVDVVITNRPVLAVAAASALSPTVASAATSTPTTRTGKPVATPSARSKTVVTSVVPSKRPRIIVVPAVKPKPPTSTVDTDTDHEVVTPPVRDDHDDDEDDHKDSPSVPTTGDSSYQSRDTTSHSGYKGD